MNRIKEMIKNLKQINSDTYGYLTPALLSRKIHVSQGTAFLILELAARSNKCEPAYMVRSPFGDREKLFGPYKSLNEIPKYIDPQTFDYDEFEVSEELIEKVYTLA
jgi:hypothetical protein